MSRKYSVYSGEFPSASEFVRAKMAYKFQRQNAIRRGIEWMLEFGEWWHLWRDSGHWHQRGPRASDYCIARNGDTGPYAIGNVSIQTMAANSAEAGRKSGGARRPGYQARGYKVVYSVKGDIRYQVQVGRKYVGRFKTLDEAVTARAAYVQQQQAA